MIWLKNWLIGREKNALIKRMLEVLEVERTYQRAEIDKYLIEHKLMLDQAYKNVLKENEYLKRLIMEELNAHVRQRFMMAQDKL